MSAEQSFQRVVKLNNEAISLLTKGFIREAVSLLVEAITSLEACFPHEGQPKDRSGFNDFMASLPLKLPEQTPPFRVVFDKIFCLQDLQLRGPMDPLDSFSVIYLDDHETRINEFAEMLENGLAFESAVLLYNTGVAYLSLWQANMSTSNGPKIQRGAVRLFQLSRSLLGRLYHDESLGMDRKRVLELHLLIQRNLCGLTDNHMIEQQVWNELFESWVHFNRFWPTIEASVACAA